MTFRTRPGPVDENQLLVLSLSEDRELSMKIESETRSSADGSITSGFRLEPCKHGPTAKSA